MVQWGLKMAISSDLFWDVCKIGDGWYVEVFDKNGKTLKKEGPFATRGQARGQVVELLGKVKNELASQAAKATN